MDFTWYQLDFGDYLSLWLLDSDHALPVAGAQTEWLAAALAAHDSRPHRFACYHKPAYGTAKPSSEAVRQHWVPLFEKYKLTAAFENDHHTYKRTHPLRQNKIDHQQGVLYLGDGAWGVGTREVKNPDAWYLAHAESRRHLILVTLDGDRQT
ncbi:MAG: metallophosphoesterase, partial [Planctomycetales bacterium]|nr:metallophosphoesterase [Planctomycetales bacterium]